ncbi:MAG: Fe-S cluster domain-containing protein [Clostridiales bacterium]|nr:Fe-S cluster domain-containing protein [Clostridiales bacterium]
MKNILWALLSFVLLGGVFGGLLALASRLFAIKRDPRIDEVTDVLPGANCGGCGYAGCGAYAEAVVEGRAKANICTAGGDSVAKAVAEVMGVSAEKMVRMRAQVMCSGTSQHAVKKYVYDGAQDCISAARLGGGDKLCPNGCIGLGTCVAACKFDAIVVKDGVAAIDYDKCTGCGTCITRCPKGIIKLIPYDSAHWVGCASEDKGAVTRKYCDVGCIGCGICVRNCPADAIAIEGGVAVIKYDKCTGCDICVEKCPRKIIWSRDTQSRGITIKNPVVAE